MRHPLAKRHIREAQGVGRRIHHDWRGPRHRPGEHFGPVVEKKNQQTGVAHAAGHQIKAGENLGAVHEQGSDQPDQQKQQDPRAPGHTIGKNISKPTR